MPGSLSSQGAAAKEWPHYCNFITNPGPMGLPDLGQFHMAQIDGYGANEAGHAVVGGYK